MRKRLLGSSRRPDAALSKQLLNDQVSRRSEDRLNQSLFPRAPPTGWLRMREGSRLQGNASEYVDHVPETDLR
jgi:hypothetical protein